MNVREPEVTALEAISESLVIDSELVKNCGVHISNMNGIFENIVGVVIRLAVFDSWPDSTAREPRGKATAMVVSAVIRFRQRSLRIDGASEFPAPENERFVQKATFVEMMGESGSIIRARFSWASASSRFPREASETAYKWRPDA